jgi:hypothetical protein
MKKKIQDIKRLMCKIFGHKLKGVSNIKGKLLTKDITVVGMHFECKRCGYVEK